MMKNKNKMKKAESATNQRAVKLHRAQTVNRTTMTDSTGLRAVGFCGARLPVGGLRGPFPWD